MLRSFKAILMLALGLAPGMAAAAAPTSVPSLVDYDASLPQEIVGMKRAPGPRVTRDDRRLVAHYGATADDETAQADSAMRGTVFVLPVAHASGANASARAQIAMLDATVDSLRRGTSLLGPGYSTGLVRTSTLRVGRVSLTCATLVRRQAPEAGDLQLADRRCFHEVPGYLIGVATTGPFRTPAEQAAREAQLAFIMGIVRALGDMPR